MRLKPPPALDLSGSSAPKMPAPPAPNPIPLVTKPLVLQKTDVGKSLTDAFVRERKIVVGTNMRQSLYDYIQEYPGGVSAFFEDSIKSFNGTLDDLIAAGVRFEDQRRAGEGPITPVNGRVSPAMHTCTVGMLEAAKVARVKRASHSKIVGGFVQLALERLVKTEDGNQTETTSASDNTSE